MHLALWNFAKQTLLYTTALNYVFILAFCKKEKKKRRRRISYMSIKHWIARNVKALIVGHWTIEHHIKLDSNKIVDAKKFNRENQYESGTFILNFRSILSYYFYNFWIELPLYWWWLHLLLLSKIVTKIWYVLQIWLLMKLFSFSF